MENQYIYETINISMESIYNLILEIMQHVRG